VFYQTETCLITACFANIDRSYCCHSDRPTPAGAAVAL